MTNKVKSRKRNFEIERSKMKTYFDTFNVSSEVEAMFLLIGVFCFCFFLEPFCMYLLKTPYRLCYSLAYACCFGYSYYLINSSLMTQRNKSKEFKDREISFKLFLVLVIVCVFLIVVCQYVLNDVLSYEDNWFAQLPMDSHFFSKLLFNVFVTILFFTMALSFYKKYLKIVDKNKFNIELLRRQYKHTNNQVSPKKPDVNSSDMTIIGLNKNEVLNLNPDQFLYAKSEGHYLKIFYLMRNTNNESPVVRSILIRFSMKALVELTGEFSSIKRVHKSYFVNIKYAKSLKRNLRGGLLRLKFSDIEVSVSKTNVNDVLSYLTIHYPLIPIYL